MKRLGLMIIGDEILAGHTQDTNTHWLAGRLKAMGVELARVETITDEVMDIATTAHRFIHDLGLDYIITSGGLGPTPDDRTMEGLARAIGVELELTDANKAWMEEQVKRGHERGYLSSPTPNGGHIKMAMLPRGAEPMPNHVGTCLGAITHTNNVMLFTLPGVPREFERMFDESVAPRLEGSAPPHVEELKLYTEESRFYETLCKLEAAHPDVTIGSYPHRGYIILRATGEEEAAKKVIAQLREEGKDFLER